MRKIFSISIALVAVFAFGAITAQGAFAELFELAYYLINGVRPANGTPVLAEGELLLEDSKLGIAVQCSGHIEGETEGPVGEESMGILVIDVLDLSGRLVGGENHELVEEGLLCKAEKGCAENTDLEVFPLNFPWLFEAMLDTETKEPWELLLLHEGAAGVAAYEVKCLVLGISTEETCEAAEGTGAEAKNSTTNGAELVEKPAEPNANCSVGGAGAGVNVPIAGGLLTSATGVVTISTPPE